MPVQKLTNPVEQIRDKESCVTSRRCGFFARYEEITSSSTSDGASGDVTSGGKVTFEPGARSARHTHALGQDLDRHRRHGLDSAVGRADRGDWKGRCYLDSSVSETLARRYAKYSDDTSQSRNSSMAKPWSGCRRSPTNNTANDSGSHPELQEVQDETDGCDDRGALAEQHIMGSGDHSGNRRKSKPMHIVNDSRIVTPALEKYAQ